jgi:hypothetical protein
MGDALQHRRLEDVHQAGQSDRLPGRELLRDHGQRGPRRLPDPERQVPGRAAHRDHEVPALSGDRVGHEIVHEVDPDAPGGLEAEGGHAAGQGQVVVDGLRDVSDPKRPSGLFSQA